MKTTLIKSIRDDGIEILIPTEQIKGEIGDEYYAEIFPMDDERSLRQLHTYWRACTFVSKNTEKKYLLKKKDVDYHCKVNCNHGEWKQVSVNFEIDKTQKVMMKLFNAGSISFKNCRHLEACGYFSDSFHLMADELNMSFYDFMSALGVKDI